MYVYVIIPNGARTNISVCENPSCSRRTREPVPILLTIHCVRIILQRDYTVHFSKRKTRCTPTISECKLYTAEVTGVTFSGVLYRDEFIAMHDLLILKVDILTLARIRINFPPHTLRGKKLTWTIVRWNFGKSCVGRKRKRRKSKNMDYTYFLSARNEHNSTLLLWETFFLDAQRIILFFFDWWWARKNLGCGERGSWKLSKVNHSWGRRLICSGSRIPDRRLSHWTFFK